SSVIVFFYGNTVSKPHSLCLIDSERICNKCSVYHLGFCYSGMKYCLLRIHQKCATENFFIILNSGVTWYHFSKLSCKINCEDEDFIGTTRRTELICCNDRDNCNIPNESL
uniref:Prostate and testis expressed 2 n=1 Tax=Monodelphis domestica TaxID=13616 RepID=A0A5F8GXG3_MONDO